MTAQGTTAGEDAGRREALRGMWASVAPAWGEHADRVDDRDEVVTAAMLDAVSPLPGERVLELACGPGGLGLAAATRVGPDGLVVLTDVADEMIAIAGGRAKALGLGNVEARARDLEAIDEPDGSFDVVVCREGLMLVADPLRAAGEIVRVLRPGGRAAVAVWGPRAANPWLGVLFDAITERTGMPVPPEGLPGPFSLDDPDRLRRVLDGGGLVEVSVREVPLPFVAASFEEWWAMVPALAGPLAVVLAGLPDDVRADIRSSAERALSVHAVGGGYAIPGVSLVGSGLVAPV